MISLNELIKLNVFDNLEYLSKYYDLISTANPNPEHPQRHHIIPKCYFTEYNLPINNQPENIVNLSLYEHTLAHFYLYMACAEHLHIQHLLAGACYRMIQKQKNLNNEQIENWILTHEEYYNQLAADFSKQNALRFVGRHHSDKTRAILSEKATGRKASEETRKKLSDMRKNKPHQLSEQGKQSMREKQKGRVTYHDTAGNIHYFRPDLGETLPEGCILGLPEEVKQKMSAGSKGQKPWNTGIPTRDDIKEKISLANKGKKRSAETRKRISAAQQNRPHPPHTEEQKKHNSEMMRGRVWIHNSEHSKFIQPEELEMYLQQGYTKGRY